MVSEMSDKLITPGRYETADEYHEKRLSKVRPYNNNHIVITSELQLSHNVEHNELIIN